MVSPLGHSVEESWANLLAGVSGIGRITQFDPSPFATQVAGEVKDFNPRDHMDFKEARRMSRASQLTVAAARMALADAGLPERLADPDRAGKALPLANPVLSVLYRRQRAGRSLPTPATPPAHAPHRHG